MKRNLTLGLTLALVVLVGLVGLAQTVVTPRSIGVLLFDNETGATISKLAIIFDKPVTIALSDIIAFGGEAATLAAISNNYAFIDVVVVPGGTVQITLRGDSADAKVASAFWFE